MNDFDPQDEEYIRDSLRLAVPCVALAVLVAVSFLLFFLIRCCCFCAGKVRVGGFLIPTQTWALGYGTQCRAVVVAII